MKHASILLAAGLSLITVTNELCARILNVPNDARSIQAGVDAARNGDTVLVHPGIYRENLNFNGKAITVASLMLLTGAEGYIDSTVIDADQNGSV
ncbi:MAG: hypothetical protein V2A61_03000, partial [Calditrichota bacterium]